MYAVHDAALPCMKQPCHVPALRGWRRHAHVRWPPAGPTSSCIANKLGQRNHNVGGWLKPAIQLLCPALNLPSWLPALNCTTSAAAPLGLQCPKSANCPVRDPAYQATCVKYVPTCNAGANRPVPHCLGQVRCAGTPCPAWEGVDCL